MIYGFWNNKGGTGKTSLCFQALTTYAHRHSDRRVLAIDVCPQANLSELLLGGLVGAGSDNLLAVQENSPRTTIGGYFQERLPSPYSMPSLTSEDFLVNVASYSDQIPPNVDLLCGDAMVELQSNSITTLANTQIPGTNTWLRVIDWLSALYTTKK
jgi:cellulose biosynthesis protein BcsQ